MDSISINIKGLEDVRNRFKGLEKKIAEQIDDVLNVNTEDIALEAKQRVPFDEGHLAQSISADNSKFLEKKITVNANYAAFVEFGSGKYAAEYVASLPDSWREFASKYRGSKPPGNLIAIQEWVRRKGIGTAKNYKSIGYLIFRKIHLNGTRPHRFLYPAFFQQQDIILKNVEDVLNGL